MNDFVKKYFRNRKNTKSSKWDDLKSRFNSDDDLLAMWVADMEFSTATEILDALKNRVDHGIFGYSLTPDSYYESFFAWMSSRHGVSLKKEWIRFNLGVVNSIYHLINIFTSENDAVQILSPVYYPFTNSVKDNNRKLVQTELLYDKNNLRFEIDYEKLESDIIKNQVKAVIFCSPHNPVGRIWDKDELIKCFDIFKKHDVLIICDEIHQDFYYDKAFVSALTLNKDYFDNLIVLNAASKTFNLACLLNSHLIIPNENLRLKYDNFAKRFNQIETNILGQLATESAYKYAGYWLDNVKEIIYQNYLNIKEQFAKNPATKDIKIIPLEGTYLLFIDFSDVVAKGRLKELIQIDSKIAVDYGDWFGENYGEFARLNLATSSEQIDDFINRIINNLSNKNYK